MSPTVQMRSMKNNKNKRGWLLHFFVKDQKRIKNREIYHLLNNKIQVKSIDSAEKEDKNTDQKGSSVIVDPKIYETLKQSNCKKLFKE